MSNNPPASEDLATNGPGRPLVDRVRERVVRAGRAIERQDTARRPRVRRRTERRRSPAAPDSPPAEPLTREVRALRSVFTDLGAAHRQYRRRTGESVSPELHAAAQAFKAAPSLVSLVPVAEFLDDLDLLEW